MPLRASPLTSVRKAIDLRLFFFALFCALIQLPLGIHGVGFGAPFELSTVASNLATSGEFRDPFGVHSGPSAHVSPVYAGLLAMVMKLFHDPSAYIPVATVLNAGLLGLGAALLPAVSRRVYGRATAGIIGGVLLGFSLRLMPQWEVALAEVVMIAATLAVLGGGPIGGGLWSGVSIFTTPVSLPMLAVLVGSRGKRFAVVASLAALAVCAPWILRNWVVLGTPYFIRDNFGLELYISNQDSSQALLVKNDPLWKNHPNQNRDEALRVAAVGEANYNRMRMHDAVAWIEAHPGRFLELTAWRIFYFWLPSTTEGWWAYSYWLVTVLGLAGVWLSRRNPTAVLLAAGAVAYSLPYAVLQAVARYRFPTLWIAALLAGYAVERLAQVRTGPDPAVPLEEALEAQGAGINLRP